MRNQKTVKIMIEVEANVSFFESPFRAERLNEPEEPFDIDIENVSVTSKNGFIKLLITNIVDLEKVKEQVMEELSQDDRGNEI